MITNPTRRGKSRHLPVRRKNSSALQGRWLEEPEGFPTHVSFRKGNKTAIMAAARQTKGSLRPPKTGCHEKLLKTNKMFRFG